MANIMGLRVQEHFRISLFLVSLGVSALLEVGNVIKTAKSKAPGAPHGGAAGRGRRDRRTDIDTAFDGLG